MDLSSQPSGSYSTEPPSEIELQGTIGQLGGQLTATQLAKAERADTPRRRFAARIDEVLNCVTTQPRDPGKASSKPSGGQSAPVKNQRKLGRNEQCRCGSGKKYKKCHLDLDR